MDTTTLTEILSNTTTPLRKGGVVKQSGSVLTIDAFPTESDLPEGDYHFADLHFIRVAVDLVAAEEMRGRFEEWLENYPHPYDFVVGESYIIVGARLGSQQLAFELFAFGEALNMWEVATPKSMLNLDGPMADRMASAGGMIGVVGYEYEDENGVSHP